MLSPHLAAHPSNAAPGESFHNRSARGVRPRWTGVGFNTDLLRSIRSSRPPSCSLSRRTRTRQTPPEIILEGALKSRTGTSTKIPEDHLVLVGELRACPLTSLQKAPPNVTPSLLVLAPHSSIPLVYVDLLLGCFVRCNPDGDTLLVCVHTVGPQPLQVSLPLWPSTPVMDVCLS